MSHILIIFIKYSKIYDLMEEGNFLRREELNQVCIKYKVIQIITLGLTY
jgi:hypothetical protein